MNWLLDLLKSLLRLLGIIKAPATPPPGPPPTPPPGPPPTPPLPMLLRASGLQLLDPRGNPLQIKGAIACCSGEGDPFDTGWALATKGFIDVLHGKRGNFLHIRPGPYRTVGEPHYFISDLGGAYLELPDGRCDLAQWNPRFWAHIAWICEYTKALGIYVEIDVMDGWILKWAKKGGRSDVPRTYFPWWPENNIEAQDWYAQQGLPGGALGAVPEAWVAKVVFETGRFDNIVYQLSNESGLIPGFDPRWETELADLVRKYERLWKFDRHLVGTCSGRYEVISHPEVDYSEWHLSRPVPPSSLHGKPGAVNEYTGDVRPRAFGDCYCAAKAQGTHFWLWRGSLNWAEFNQAMDFFGSECGNERPCLKPPDLVEPPLPGQEFYQAYIAAIERVKAARADLFVQGDVLKGWAQTPPERRQPLYDAFCEALSRELCGAGFMAGKEGEDDIAIGKDGFVEYYHPVAWGPGRIIYSGKAGADGFFKGRFRYASV